MAFVLVQQIIHQFMIHLRIGNEFDLCRDITGLIVFSLIFVNILLIFLFFLARYIIFVQLFHNKKHRIWNRLLYFIRAVGLSTLTGSPRMVGGRNKELYWPYNSRFPGKKRCAFCWLMAWFVSADYFHHLFRVLKDKGLKGIYNEKLLVSLRNEHLNINLKKIKN